MSKVYDIEIEETMQKVVKIKANSLNQAIDIAQNRYSNQEYILEDEVYKGVEFREYKDEVIKEKKQKNRESRQKNVEIYSTRTNRKSTRNGLINILKELLSR